MPLNRTLVNQILSLNPTPMRAWNFRRNTGGSHRLLIRKIRQILNLISGNNIVSMLKHVLTKAEKHALLEKYVLALQNFSAVYNETPQKQRHKYLFPLRDAGFSLNNAKSLGYNATHHMWRSCLNENDRNKGGHPALDVHTIREIDLHLESLSSIAANRFLKKENTNAFHRQVSLTEAYTTFELEDEISFTAFYNHVPNKYKTPNRLSDLCDYCEYSRALRSEILDYAIEIDHRQITDLDDLNVQEFRAFLVARNNEDERIAEILDKIKDCITIESHKIIAKRQRDAYNQMRGDIIYLKDRILIDIDFKQKIILGRGPREANSDYYNNNRKQRSFIGFGVHYVVGTKVKCINMDVVLDDTSQECIAAILAFRFIRKQPIFKAIDKKKYTIWTDCGAHFRCNEFVSFLFTELARQHISVNWNLFGEKHGKHSRDQHFSAISNFLESESMVKRLMTTQDIVDAVKKRQKIANEYRSYIQLPPVQTWIEALDLDGKRKHVRVEQKIPDLTCYYNFQHDADFNIKSSVFADINDFLIDVNPADESRLPATVMDVEDDVPPRERPLTRLMVRLDNIIRFFRNNNYNNPNTILIGDYMNVNDNQNRNVARARPEEPQYCKEACFTCEADCLYTILELPRVNQTKINEELKNHNHPSSRKISKTHYRTTIQARLELTNHYQYAHLLQ